jgi:glycosyltransferase involved in cell wall biosynthesis
LPLAGEIEVMKKVAIFSRFFGYNVGGAERSVLELMKAVERQGNDIVALINTQPSGYLSVQRLNLPASWRIQEFHLPLNWRRFRFVDYFINKKRIEALARDLRDVDILYAYGHLAPALINAFPGETVYLARDEYALGWNVNYYSGVRGVAQSLYHASEYGLYRLWRRDLHRAAQKSRLIANSEFIARNLRLLSPESELEIIYPQVDEPSLVASYARQKKDAAASGVMLIGDNVLKGGDIARKAAKRLPEIPFYIFDRRYTEQKQTENLFFMPWQADPGAVYAYARVVMIPSRWHEAYGRVAYEAQLLGLPVIASDRGGLPEVMQDKSCLVTDIDNIDAWVQQIRRLF